MTDNKEYPYPTQPGQAPPYPGGPTGYPAFPGGPGGAVGFPGGPGAPVGFPAYPGAPGGNPPYPATAGLINPGYGMDGFGGQGVGMMGPAPPMGFHLPNPSQPTQPSSDDERYKYSSGGEGGNSYGGDIHGLDFSEKTIRRAFIRKVYGILSIQILLTSAIVSVMSFHEGVRGYFRTHFWLALPIWIAAIVLLLVIACCEGLRRKSPHNVILLGVFTITYGFLIGLIASTRNMEAVAYAALITAVIVIGLTAFAFQTKIDFTMMGGTLFCCALVFFIFGFLMIFLPKISILHKIYSCLGALLFSIFLVYDTQLMMGGSHKFSISPEEYVFAALNLYLDIIQIFLHILNLFGRE